VWEKNGNIAHQRIVAGRRILRILGRNTIRQPQRVLEVVSHELRSPLTRLCVTLGQLRECSPEDRTELEAEYLDKSIGQLLTLAKINSGADSRRMETFDPGNLIQEIAADGDLVAQSRCCSVQVDSLESCW
jgi:K+-sensing histidine kinase KdpD